MVYHMRNLLKSKIGKFSHKLLGTRRRKAQFFILSALTIVGILYLVSRWSEPYTIIDTSAVAVSEEIFIFNNVVDKARYLAYNTCENPEELEYSLEEYKAFVENYALGKNINIDFDISHVTFSEPTVGYIDISLSSPTRTLSRRLNVDRSFGVVGWWRLDDGREDIASDSSGNENYGTVYGGSWSEGRIGQGLTFDGGDYFEAYPFVYDFTQITAEFWMNTDDTVKNGSPISCSKSGEAANEFLIYNYRNFRIYVDNGYVDTGVSANDGKWHHIAVTWRRSDGSVKLFKDGVEAYSGTLKQGVTIHLGNVIVGQEQDSFRGGFDSSQEFIGTIDEVRIWDTALSADQISAHVFAQ